MAIVVIYVLDDTSLLTAILEAWEKAGAPAVTILDSTGTERLRHARLREDLPLLPSLADLLADDNVYNKTLFSFVSSEEIVDRIVEATRHIVGDFSEPHTGVLCAIPLSRAYGLDKTQTR